MQRKVSILSDQDIRDRMHFLDFRKMTLTLWCRGFEKNKVFIKVKIDVYSIEKHYQ